MRKRPISLEADTDMQHDELDRKDPIAREPGAAGSNREDIDALVTGFLEELAAVSSEIKGSPQLEVVEKATIQNPPSPETRAPSLELDGKSPFDSGLDIAKIQKELEESLNELEQLKAKVVPIMDRKETKPEPEASPKAETQNLHAIPVSELQALGDLGRKPLENVPASAPNQDKAPSPVEGSGSKPSAVPKAGRETGVASQTAKAAPKAVAFSAPRESEEQAWNRMELFRSQVASRRKFPWRKLIIWSAILAGFLAAAYIFYIST